PGHPGRRAGFLHAAGDRARRHPSPDRKDAMPQPVTDTIAELTETVASVTIEVPISMLRRAQAARSEYSDYGSNDEEHDILGEFCDLVAMASEDVGFATWRIFVDLPATLTEADVDAIKGDIPSDLAD